LRLFVAALLPEEVRMRLGEYINKVRPLCEGVRWEHIDKLHVTLKFLGNVEDGKAPEIGSIIGSLSRLYNPFDTAISGAGGFPDLRNPRVLYVGLSGNPGLSSLQAGIEEALEPLGFEREKRIFIPHVTIGRVKSRLRIKEPLPEPEPYEFAIDEIGLIKSETRRDGSVYTPLHIFRLNQH
jgi:2'-5' RNA ligase